MIYWCKVSTNYPIDFVLFCFFLQEGSSEQNTPSEVKSLSLTSLDDFILESDSEDNLKSNNQQKTTDIADVPVSMCTELDTSYDILCDSELYKVERHGHTTPYHQNV